MESLYLLLPLSVLLVLALIGLFGWAINSGQFDDLEREAWRVLEETPQAPASGSGLDPDQVRAPGAKPQFRNGI